MQRGRVRRAKLYYLRELRGKKARIRERREAPGKAVLEPEPAAEETEEPAETGEAEPVEVEVEEAPETESRESESEESEPVAAEAEGQG